MPGLREVLDGGGRTVPGGDVLFAPLPGESVPPTAGVAGRRYGNAVAERKLSFLHHSRPARVPAVGGARCERPRFALCPVISGPRHRLR